MTCPYDPRKNRFLNYLFKDFICPECGCDVIAGLRHGPCVESDCPYYDEHHELYTQTGIEEIVEYLSHV